MIEILTDERGGVAPGGADLLVVPVLAERSLGTASALAPDLDALAESFRAAGLAVELQRFGRFEGVAESVQLTAYRIVQEGLTNARRHGDGAAVVRVAREPSSLRVAISNGIGPQTDGGGPGGGFGLSGMRERVAAVGGTIRAGRAGDDRFRVDATLPTGRSGSE